MRIWLLRHAQSTWNAAGRWQGHGDPPLSDRGRAAAAARAGQIAECVRRDRALRIYSSDLERAADTATFLARALGAEATPLPALRELDVGSWTGLTRPEIEARDADALVAFESEDPDVRPGGGETRRELRRRALAAVESLAAAHPSGDLLLVVHLGVMRALVPRVEPDHLDLLATDLPSIRRVRSRGAGR